MHRAVRLLAIVVLALAAAASAQQYTESLEIRLHNFDAVVTDREGKAVTGLTREDFVILEDGVPQAITNFAFYDAGIATVVPATAGESPELPSASGEAPPPRRYVFFIDEMAIQASARNKLKTAALALVRTMRPGDVATVVRPTGTAKIVQDYTGDVAAVEKSLGKAIDDCRIRMTAPAFAELNAFRRALETADSQNEINAAKREYAERSRARVAQRITQLRALVTTMGADEGKKILVLITSGLSSQPGREAYSADEQIGIFEVLKEESEGDEYQRVYNELAGEAPTPDEDLNPLGRLKQDLRAAQGRSLWKGMEKIEVADFKTQIDNLARAAAVEGVTIYALEPEVPLMLDTGRGADAGSRGSTLLSTHLSADEVVPSEMLGQLLHHGGETLTSLTERTGGRWFRGVSSIDDTFRQVSEDLRIYYSLAYRQRGNDARPRKVTVTVKNRPDLRVRTRSEVIDGSATRDMSGRVLANLVYPRDLNNLAIQVNTEKARKKGRAYVVPFEVVIPVEKLTFLPSDDGVYRARVIVHYATAREEKEFVSYGGQEQIVELSQEQHANPRMIRYRYRGDLTVPRGEFRVAVGVVDKNSRTSSLQTMSVVAR